MNETKERMMDEIEMLRQECTALRTALTNLLPYAEFGAEDELLEEARAALRQADSMRRALHEIAEVWAGAECGEPVYAQEAYAIGLARRMYALAVEGLTPNDSFNELITLRADAERYREWRRAFREDVMLGVIDAEAKEIQNDYSDS